MRRRIVALEPPERGAPDGLAPVFAPLRASSRCRGWYKPGLLLIGDAAHTMTPAAAGIKYASKDAVVAANVLTAPLLAKRVRVRDLAAVQRQREWPTWVIQAFGAFLMNRMLPLALSGRLAPKRVLTEPERREQIEKLVRQLKPLTRVPFLLKLMARFVAFGFSQVHVKN
jgi:2-polyprenyl-6-methoxyphenol hydroxylase-like FAD-dependent oxidoreductase